MTLKKDALVAVSIAGVVLAMAGASTQVGRANSESTPEAGALQKHDRDLLQIYIDSLNAKAYMTEAEAERYLAKARKTVISLWQSDRDKNPIDHYRAAAILKTSEDPKELALAHELSVTALARGIKVARKIALESQDRLLLSTGNGQRYGTQATWDGRILPTYGKPTADITPQLQDDLGIRNVKVESVVR